MSYFRVIPRDLFNEGNLLKCLGRLYLNLETLNFPSVELEHDGEPFQIEQSEDGSLFVLNVQLCVKDRVYLPWRPLNSREAWPLYVTHEEQDIAVFDQDGTFTQEMLNFLWQRIGSY